ncbi:MAG: VapC toxin family PIN domain ribonuclease, partial [Deltaproteobacteria bacterium]|nr:VapC toxin family PIN domain ribonuclease [Deltaproteobacteria bacterium]
ARAFEALATNEIALISSSYVLIETYALLQRRVGLDATLSMRDAIAPLIDVVWVGRSIHDAALDRLIRSAPRKLSLVDCASFEIMDRQGLRRAFTYDKHFSQEGFTVL